MSTERHIALALRLLGATLAVAVLGAYLLPHSPVGLGAALFASIAIGAALIIGRERLVPVTKGLSWIAAPALLLSVSLAWRDSVTLHMLDVFGIVILGGYALMRSRTGQLWSATILELPVRAFGRWINTIEDAFYLFDLQGKWPVALQSRSSNGQVQAVVRGMALSLPVLVIFGMLLTQSDAGFEKLMSRFFNFSLESWVNPILTFTIVAVLYGGLLFGLYLRPAPREYMGPHPKPSIGLTEVAIVLGLVNLLFLAFVSLQSSYLFGGEGAVRAISGLGIAEYARRGFFELVTVAGLSLALLLATHSTLSPTERRQKSLFPVLASIQIALVAVVMASAAQRMRLYVGQFGISEQRFYVFAILVWLGALFVWFGFTVLRGRERQFAPGATLAFLASTFALHAVNPDALIARINLTRDRSTLDQRYLTTLSLDATPILAKAVADQPELLTIREHLDKQEIAGDWRAWSYARSEATRTKASP